MLLFHAVLYKGIISFIDRAIIKSLIYCKTMSSVWEACNAQRGAIAEACLPILQRLQVAINAHLQFITNNNNIRKTIIPLFITRCAAAARCGCLGCAVAYTSSTCRVWPPSTPQPCTLPTTIVKTLMHTTQCALYAWVPCSWRHIHLIASRLIPHLPMLMGSQAHGTLHHQDVYVVL